MITSSPGREEQGAGRRRRRSTGHCGSSNSREPANRRSKARTGLSRWETVRTCGGSGKLRRRAVRACSGGHDFGGVIVDPGGNELSPAISRSAIDNLRLDSQPVPSFPYPRHLLNELQDADSTGSQLGVIDFIRMVAARSAPSRPFLFLTTESHPIAESTRRTAPLARGRCSQPRSGVGSGEAITPVPTDGPGGQRRDASTCRGTPKTAPRSGG